MKRIDLSFQVANNKIIVICKAEKNGLLESNRVPWFGNQLD
jgi:hypothetical protein